MRPFIATIIAAAAVAAAPAAPAASAKEKLTGEQQLEILQCRYHY